LVTQDPFRKWPTCSLDKLTPFGGPGITDKIGCPWQGRQSMRRRAFLGLVGGVAAAWPVVARAQQMKPLPRVGVLWHAGSADEEEVYLSVLQKAFHDLGYVEGKNITLEHRFPAEQADRFRSMARELAESKVDVIIAVSGIGAREAQQTTRTIPIVVVLEADPVGSGLIESLSHPG